MAWKLTRMMPLVRRQNLVLKSGWCFRPAVKIAPMTMVTIYTRVEKCRRIDICFRNIHLSSCRNAPPLLLLLLRPLLNLGAMVFGRVLRKWWAKLPEEEREKIRRQIRARQTHIWGGCILALTTFLGYYLAHVKEDPITKRKRFIIYTDEQVEFIAKLEYTRQVQEFRTHIVPPGHVLHRRISNVASRILAANKDIEGVKKKEWDVTVIDLPEITNAFVLAHGKIFVFTGMLNVCTNDDQLAIVLAHEISHALLSHVAETLSQVFLVEMLLLVPLVLFWAVFSDVGALFSQWLSSQLAEVMIHLPFSRAVETEADGVGLYLAARACFDIREAPVFWAKMNAVTHSSVPVEFLSTHPSHETRQSELADMMPIALKIREASECPLLPPLTATQSRFSPQPAFLFY